MNVGKKRSSIRLSLIFVREIAKAVDSNKYLNLKFHRKRLIDGFREKLEKKLAEILFSCESFTT